MYCLSKVLMKMFILSLILCLFKLDSIVLSLVLHNKLTKYLYMTEFYITVVTISITTNIKSRMTERQTTTKG